MDARTKGASHIDGIHCPTCADHRPVDVDGGRAVYEVHGGHGLPFVRAKQPNPGSVFGLTCRVCATTALGVVYTGPNGLDLAILWSCLAGLTTKHTPPPVAYYLDQAGRCEAMGARSAAVAMYRAALEHLLHEQGFTTGMLDAKIKELVKRQAAGTGPAWAAHLDAALLSVLKELGNGAIHANGGDHTKQAAFDPGSIADIQAAVAALLEIVYEEPARASARMARLNAAAAVVQK